MSSSDLLTGDWSQHYTQSYYSADYNQAGYNSFLSKSIDVQGQVKPDPSQVTLNTPQQYSNNSVNYDFAEVSGSLGDVVRVGFIRLDGASGRISIEDETGNEIVRIGELDG